MAKRKALSPTGARYLFLGAALFLAALGLVMVFSAAFVGDYLQTDDSAHTLKRQLLYVAGGLLILLVASRFDYHKLWRLAWPALIAIDVALVAVLVMGITRGGSTRWIDVGFATFQPSELAKVACVLALAVIATDGRIRDEAHRLGRVLLVLPPVLLLVMLEPDMGTAMAILLSSFIVLWLGGLSWGKTFTLGGIAAAFTGVGIAVAPYRLQRFLAFRDPWADPLDSGYQSVQAIMAFASGGITGTGLGMSRQKFSYLPEAHTDFILAVIGEELGLLGTLAVVIAFVTLAVAGFRIAIQAKDPFGKVLAGGLTALVVTQASINMLAVTNLIPVTGIPLPLVSFGGNSMIATMIAIGLVVSVSRFGSVPVPETARKRQRGGSGARTSDRRRDRRTHPPRASGRGASRG